MKITNRRMKEKLNMRKSKPSGSKREQEINSTYSFNDLRSHLNSKTVHFHLSSLLIKHVLTIVSIKSMNMLFTLLILTLISFPHFTNAQQSQSFILKPSNAKVNIGDTVIFKCSVTLNHGDVQWVHEGTALGYDRKILGKPRYSVVWDNEENKDSEYHLKITNITLEDEGTFSCQVAPIGDWDTKLESRAKLTVLVAPQSTPEIMFNDETKHPNEIVHFRSMSLKATQFTCTVRKSKPAVKIKWFLNGSAVNGNVGKSKDTIIQNGIFEDTVSVFELKQQTNLVYNNSIIKCQAYHEIFGLTTDIENMSVPLRIVVVYPPKVPVITGYNNDTGIIAGSELRLICSSAHSYPPAMLSWYRDGKLVSKNYDTIESTKTTESLYRIAKVTRTDNRAVFKCNAINQAMDEPFSTNVTLNVLFGPDKIAMNGVFEVEAGQPISAVCSSEPSNPSPRLRFNFDGIDYEPNSFTSTPTADSVAVGAFVVNGSFTKTVRPEHNNKELKCYIENKEANIQQIMTKQIKVLYGPDSLDMSHFQTDRLLNEGTRVRVSCLSRGGNPLPEIEWTLDGTTKLKATSTNTMVYSVESTIDFILEREHHMRSLQCKAVNKVGSLTKQVVLSVSYLPSDVIISVLEPTVVTNQLVTNVSVKAGTNMVFACRSPNSNPQPFITWFKDSYPILLNAEEKQNVTSKLMSNKDYDTTSHMSFVVSSADHLKEIRCDVRVRDLARTMHGSMLLEVQFPPEIIKHPSSIIEMNENGTFSLNLTARANPAPTYTCTASNKRNYTVVNGMLNFTVSKTDNADFTCAISNNQGRLDVMFKLNVKYSPTARINKTSHIISKGESTQIFCIIDANPLESSHITWKINNNSLINKDTEQFYSFKFIPPDVSVLTILNARDVDDGEIGCHVSNKIGKPTVATSELRVKRSPLILVDKSTLKAGEDSNIGRSAFFSCKAKAYPDVKFKWKAPDNGDINNSTKYLITESKLEEQVFVSSLTIYSVSSIDYGTYTCEARNLMGSTIVEATLSGKHQPEKPSDFKVTNITKNSISLTWKANFDGGDSQKYRIRFRKDTMDPTYRYVETLNDMNTFTLDNLEPATRYIINIQSFNKFGTAGYLREPLIVQTDFGFNEINQMPIFTGNDVPLTIILIICGSGTIFMLFNVAFIIYLIKKRKKKGEADSTTDTNETEANTVEMFSPPPPYPDELNYDFNLSANPYDEEHKPFVPQFHPSHNKLNNRYLRELNDQLDYAIEYATPIHQNPWQNENCNNMVDEDDVYISSLRQLDQNIAAAIAGVSALPPISTTTTVKPLTIRSSFNNNRLSYINRPFTTQSNSFHQNLNKLSSVGDNYLIETRAFPFDRNNQTRLSSNRLNNYRANSSCKIYQDLDEFKDHLGEFKGHLV